MKRSRPFRRPAQPASSDAYPAALRLVAGRELTTFQLRDRLARRGFGAPAVENALTRLTAERALDDRRAALAAARRALVKRHGPSRAEREVEALGVDRELARLVVREVFGEFDEDVLVERAVAKRLRGRIADAATFRRLHAYLVRQGFSSATALKALKMHAMSDAPSSDDQASE